MKKRLVSLFLSFVLLLTLFPASTIAATAVASGTCGDNLTWSLDESGTLTIEGTGAMADWIYGSSPWHDCKESIRTVTIRPGVTSIGDFAFDDFSTLTDVTIPEGVTSIGSYAFSDRNRLTSISVPASVTSIGTSAFLLCGCINVDSANSHYSSDSDGVLYNKDKTTLIHFPNLFTEYSTFEEIQSHSISYAIPDGVEHIEESAFWNNSLLTSITIPDSVTSIGDGAFRHCYYLTSATVKGDAPTYFGIDVFNPCGSGFTIYAPAGNTTWTSSSAYNAAAQTWKGYPIRFSPPTSGGGGGGGSATVIDSGTCGENLTWTLDSDGLLTIEGTGAIMDYDWQSPAPWSNFSDRITSLYIGSGVTSIGKAAFRYCSNLASVTIPEGVTSIGIDAFDYCENLTSVTLPDSVKSIGAGAFFCCSSLSSVTIPAGVTYVGEEAFAACGRLADIMVAEGNTAYCVDSAGVLFDKNKTTLIQAPAGSLSGSYIIPDGVTAIGHHAFCDCDSLAALTIPASVERIGVEAFSACDALSVINVAAENRVYSSDAYGVLFNKNQTELLQYPSGNTASSYEIPASVTEIGYAALAENENLTSVTIPNGVTCIGYCAFYFCTNLTSITIPNSVTRIEGEAFNECFALTSITIPAGVTYIGDSAFVCCTGLTSVIFEGDAPSGLNETAFEDCADNFTIYAPSGNTTWTSSEAYDEAAQTWNGYPIRFSSPTSGGGGGGGSATVIDSGICGDNLTWKLDSDDLLTIEGTGAMMDYDWQSPAPWSDFSDRITSLYIGSGVTSIGKAAFRYCSNLASVTIPEGVTSVSDSAFSDCTALRRITLPDSVKSIGACAFSGCSSLSSVTIPAGVTYVGEEAFAVCGRLADIMVAEGNTAYCVDSAGVLFDKNKTTLIQAPAGSLSGSYVIPDGVTAIGHHAFCDCDSLAAVTIPASVEWIGVHVFSACDALSVINVAAENRVYSSDAYGVLFNKNQTELLQYPSGNTASSYEIPASVTEIGYAALSQNENLTSVTIPNGVTCIGAYAFEGCESLTSVTIPDSVTSIGDSAFVCCTGLTSVIFEGDAPSGLNETAFEDCADNFTIYAPSGNTTWTSSSAYNAAAQTWNGYPIVFDVAAETVASGYCGGEGDGTNLTWALEAGTLTIEGTGAMADYDWKSPAPWYDLRDEITSLCVGAGVTSIGNEVFKECYNLMSATIPEGVTLIGDSAFFGCYNLMSVTIPSSVTSIGFKAFGYCESLTSITIPSSVAFLGEGSFSRCSALKSVIFEGNAPTDFGYGVFDDCADNFTIFAPAGNTTWTSSEAYDEAAQTWNGYPIVFDVAAETVASGYCGGEGDGTNLTWSLDESGTLTIEGTGAMADFTWEYPAPWSNFSDNITSLYIDSGVTSIGNESFSGCYRLISAELPEGIISIGDWAFSDCSNLWSVAIPEGLTSIGGWAFSCCTSISSITIPNSVTSLGDGAFSSCYSLTSATIPGSVTTVSDDLFSGCSSLASVTIPDSVTHIGGRAFHGCSDLISVTIPDSVTTIGSFAFRGCTRLMGIAVEAGNAAYSSDEYGVLFDKAKTKLIQYPIGNECTAYTIPNSVTFIDDSAFSNCSLTGITIPSSMTSIGDDAFWGCYSLTSATFEGGAPTDFGYCVFDSCADSFTIHVPAGNTTWTSTAAYDAALQTWNGYQILFGDEPQISIIASGYCGGNNEWEYDLNSSSYKNLTWRLDEDGVLTISGEGAMMDYQYDTGGGFASPSDFEFVVGSPWVGYRDRIITVVLEEGVTTVGNNAFRECNNMTSAILPDGVTSIGDYAFCNCTSLTVTIPASVTSIGNYAFLGCYRVYEPATVYVTIVTKDGIQLAAEPISTTAGSTIEDVLKDAHRLYCQQGEAGFLAGIDPTYYMYTITQCWGITATPFIVLNSSPLGAGENSSSLTANTTGVKNGDNILVVADNSFTLPIVSIAAAPVGDGIGLTVQFWWLDYNTFQYVSAPYANADVYDENGVLLGKTGEDGTLTVSEDVQTVVIPGVCAMQIRPEEYIASGTCGAEGDNLTWTLTSDGALTVSGTGAMAANAFANRTDIKSVIIQPGVTSIGDNAFASCYALTSIEIPKGLTSIGMNAFSLCSLASINLPASLTSIGDGAFAFCPISAYSVHPDNENYRSEDGVLYSKDMMVLIAHPVGALAASFEIPETVTGIAPYAFHSNYLLTSITIPDSVTTIGYSAFSFCYCLPSITIPANVSEIGASAFTNCATLSSIDVDANNPNFCTVDGVLYSKDKTALVTYPAGKTNAEFTVPDGVAGIYSGAFSSCANLTELTLPASITSIGFMAFDYCTSLTDIYFNGTEEQWNNLIAYYFGFDSSWRNAVVHFSKTGTCGDNLMWTLDASGTLTISGEGAMREMYDLFGFIIAPSWAAYASEIRTVVIEEGVTSIGASAFSNCSNLTDVTIPDSVTSIGANAFSGCISLTSITIPDSVTSIGDWAFSNCSGLTGIEIPEGVTSIGAGAFAFCGLASVSLPAGLTFLGDGAFEYCPVSAFSVASENANYCAVGGILYTKDMKTLFAYPAAALANSFEIPDTVTGIAPYAFSMNSNLSSITIPDSVTTICDFAFTSCFALSNITVPAGVSQIGAGAFSGCISLNSIALDGNNPYFCTVDGVLYSKDKATLLAYPAGKTDTVFTVPSGVAAIGGGAFNGTNLTEITIPEGVELIDGSAFSNSVALRRITLPASITSIGFAAFDGCASLTDIYFNGTEEQWSSLTAFYFGFDSSLQNATVHFAKTGTCGGEGDGTNLTWKLDGKGTLTISGEGAMGAMYDPISWSVSVPWSAYTSEIKTVVIKEGVTTICANAFSNCANLTSVTLPNSVTSIGDSAFASCYALTSIEIPEGVTSIGTSVFFFCNVASISLPASVTTIADGAFGYCFTSAFSVNPENTNYCAVDGVLYTKDMTVLVAYPLSAPVASLEIPDTVTRIAPYAFSMTSKLNSITIPDSVTTIGHYAFFSCYSLSDITVPASVSEIGAGAFSGCAALNSIVLDADNPNFCTDGGVLYSKDKTVLVAYPAGKTDTVFTVPNGVTAIGSGAFCGTNLTEITIPEGVASVSDSAFSYSAALRFITLPASLTSIGFMALDYCTSLTDIYFNGTEEQWNGLIAFYSYYSFDSSLQNATVHFGGTPTDVYSGTCGAQGDNLTWTLDEDGLLTISGTGAMMNYDYGNGGGYASPSDFVYVVESPWKQYRDRITSVVLNDGVTSIGDNAFRECYYLTSVTIPNSVTFIGTSAFNNCTNLTSITIPTNVTSVGDTVFYRCTSLRSATFEGDAPTEFGNGVFDCCADSFTIYAQYGNTTWTSGEAYDADAQKWNGYPIRFYGEPPHEHNYETRTVDPTCTEQGYTLHICECGSSYRDTFVSALGHSYPDTWKPYSDTKHIHRCSRCDAAVEYGDHLWDGGTVTVDATSNTVGIRVYRCSECDAEKSETIPALRHTFTETIVEPTCTAKGYTLHTCTTCADGTHSYIDSYVPAKGHTYQTTVVEPTCTQKGYTLYTCEHCGSSYISDYVSATGHSWDAGAVTLEATADADGIRTFTCTSCGITRTEGIPALGHTFTKEIVLPTCVAKGYTRYTCMTCAEHSYMSDYKEALGHHFTEKVVPPTCTSRGYTVYTCTDCGLVQTGAYVDKLQHSYQITAVQQATADAAGYTEYTCRNCGDSFTVEIPALGHEFTSVVTAPTCTEQGYTTYFCETCEDGEHSYEDCFVPAKGHSWKPDNTVEANCTRGGYKVYVCETCGAQMIADQTPMTEHQYENGICKDCHAHNPDKHPNSPEHKKAEDMSGMSEELAAAFSDVDALLAEMTEQVALLNNGERPDASELYEFTLTAEIDGEKTTVMANDFPEEGVEVIIPYPVGTDKKTKFNIVHMFSNSYGGHLAGEMECPAFWPEDDGIHMILTSLSPVFLSWEDEWEVVLEPTVEVDRNAGSVTVTPSYFSAAYCIASVYSEAGQLISSKTASVTEPDQPLTLSGLTFPDSGYTVKVFLLDRNYRPVCSSIDIR